LRSGLVRSARVLTPFGLPLGTAMTSWFLTKTTGAPAASPASVTVFIVVGLAAANTSAGAPEVICWARPELPPYEKVTSRWGFCASKSLPILSNDSVSDAAASTVSLPVALVPALEPVELEPPAGASELALLSPQPAVARTAVTASPIRILLTRRPLVPRPRWST
jgi:hypothetical protein